MSRLLLPVVAALLAAAVTAGLATAGRDGERGPRWGGEHAIGLWGDVPYSEEQTTTGVPNLVADMRQRLAFTVHDGDIKSGSSRCDDAVYQLFESYLNSLRAPAFYTPGDNEWTDCDRPAAGGYDSEERLAYLRANLFDEPPRTASAGCGSAARTRPTSRTFAGGGAACSMRPCTWSGQTTTAPVT